MPRLILVSLCIAALAGCHSRSATVTFTPAALKDCGANNVATTIEVNWDATQAKPKNGVKLSVSNKKPERTGVFAGDPGTTWIYGAVTGSGITGAWVFPGTTIIVTDPDNDDVLASVQIPSAPCG